MQFAKPGQKIQITKNRVVIIDLFLEGVNAHECLSGMNSVFCNPTEHFAISKAQNARFDEFLYRRKVDRLILVLKEL